MRDETVTIRILKETKDKIKILAKEKGLREVTILEYLLNGKIDIKELYGQNDIS